MTREAKCKLLALIEEGQLDKDTVVKACVNYMSESEVADMCHAEGFIDEEEEEEEEPEYEFTDGDEVNEAFSDHWDEHCREVPAYRTDKPAKRMAFTCFVDDLQRDGRISDDLASEVTLADE